MASHNLTPIGLDAADSGPGAAVTAVQLKRDPARPSGWSLHAAATIELGEQGLFTAEDARRIAEVLKRQGFRGTRVILAPPARDLVWAPLALPPRSSGAPIERLAGVELARTGGLDAACIETTCWDVPAPARVGAAGGRPGSSASGHGQTHVIAAGYPHKQADELLAALERAGLEPIGSEPRPCALVRALTTAASLRAGAEQLTVVVDIGSWAAVTIVLGDRIVYTRTLSEHGLGAMAGEVLRAGRVDPESASVASIIGTLVRGPGGDEHASGADPLWAPLVGEHVDALGDEVKAAISYAAYRYRCASDGRPDGGAPRVLLCGRGAMLPGAADRIAARIGVPTEPVRIGDLAHVPPALQRQADDTAMAAAAGLALHAAGGTALRTAAPGASLIPAHRRHAASRRRRVRVWTAVAGAYALATVGAYIGAHAAWYYDRPALEEQLEQLRQTGASHQQRVQQLQAELRTTQNNLIASRAVGDQPDWSILLALLSERAGEDILIRRCQIRAADDTAKAAGVATPTMAVTALGMAQRDAAGFIVRLEQTGLFDKVQLVSSERSTFLGREVTRFDVHCTLSTAAAEPPESPGQGHASAPTQGDPS